METDGPKDEKPKTEGLPGASLLRSDIMAPRQYQLAIVKDAVEKNALVVLPTGLGKTLVSALSAAYLLERNPEMRVLIMAPTRPLVQQHKESFLHVLNLDEASLVSMTGEIPPQEREQLWTQGQVFFTTPQIVENDIALERLILRDFCLVVFDEAHRAVKDYAYTAIARHYMNRGVYPLLLGLTASPGGNKDRVQEVCQALYIEKIIYRTHEDEDVRPYVHNIETEWREVELPQQYFGILRLLERMLDVRVDKLRSFLPSDGMGGPPRYINKMLILNLGDKLREKLNSTPGPERGPIFGYMMLQSSCLSLLHSIELLESQGIRALMRFLNKLEDEKDQKKTYRNIINDALYPDMFQQVVDNLEIEHPKVEQLKLEIVKQYGRDKTAKVLVFTQYRDTAALLTSALKNDVFVVERFVGQASRLGDEGLNQEAQHEVLERFRNGEISVLVATSVAEEGLDIPDVDLVVFYEPIPSEIRFIQRKGRTGRSRVGKAVILSTQDSIDTASHQASQRKIKRMKELMSHMNTTLAPIQRGPRPPPAPSGTRPTRPKVRPLSSTAERPLECAPRPGKNGPGAEKGIIASRVSPHVSHMAPGPTTESIMVREWMLALLERKEEVFIEDLLEYGYEDGFRRGAVLSTLDDLRKEGLVFKPSWDAVRKIKEKKDDKKDHMDVLVVRVEQGCAFLLVNDSVQVRLEPEEFPGNHALIKKGKRFRVKGKLYEMSGKRYLRVFDVLE